MLFKRDKSWSITCSVSTGNKPPSTAISWWGWLGAGGSSPGHQRQIPSREERRGITQILRSQPVFQNGNMEEIKQCVPQAWFPWTALYNPGVMKASLVSFYAEHNSNRFICIFLKYKTGMYFISKDKICLSSIFFLKNFPSLKKWLSSFRQQLSSQPTGSAGG